MKKTNLNLRAMRTLLSCGAVIAFSGVAMAQDAPAPAQPAQGQSSSGLALEDIVVTANRIENNLQDVPVSVTAVTGSLLEKSNITNAGQLTFVAPTLQLTGNSSGRGATQFAIRGIGTASFSHLLESSVSTVIDGVPLGRPDLGFTDFADLERVEVLAGPQGTLFGKNATGGVINIVGRRPQIGITEGSASVSGAIVEGAPTDAHNVIVQGMVNLPTSENSALRLNASYTDHGSLFRQINTHPGTDLGKKQMSVKAKFLWEPTDALSFYVIGDYSFSEGLGTGLATQRGYYWGPVLGDGLVTPGPENVTTSINARADLNYDIGGINFQTTYEFDNGFTISNITAWRKYTGTVYNDNDGFNIDFDLFIADFDYEQFSSELRLESPRGNFIEGQVGLYYFDGSFKRPSPPGGGLGGLPAVEPGWETNRGSSGEGSTLDMDAASYAAYGEATVNFTDAFRAFAGARFTHDKTSTFQFSDNRGTFLAPGGLRSYEEVRKKNSEDDLSYRFGVQFDATDDVMLYGTYSRGYKGGGYNFVTRNLDISGRYVEPEIAKVYELGVKSTLFDNRVRFNAAAFYGKYFGFQAQGYDTNVPGGAFTFNNAGTLRTQGGEAQLDVLVAEGFTLTGSIAYVDAIYKKFIGAPCYGGQTEAQGCVGGVDDVSGNRLTNAPKWSGNLSGNYETALSDNLDGHVRAEFSYRSSVNFSANEQFPTRQGPVGLVNGYIGLGAVDDRWDITLFCKNCFDKRFVNYVSPVQGYSSSYRQNFALDSFRQIGLTVATKF